MHFWAWIVIIMSHGDKRPFRRPNLHAFRQTVRLASSGNTDGGRISERRNDVERLLIDKMRKNAREILESARRSPLKRLQQTHEKKTNRQEKQKQRHRKSEEKKSHFDGVPHLGLVAHRLR